MGKLIRFINLKGGNTMLNVNDVAKTFLAFEPMTHKKLQKLCYYAQALHLAKNMEPMMDTEFQAWVHGPVSPELYQEYRTYGSFNIPKQIKSPIPEDSYEYAFISSIYKRYGHLTGNELENLTHTEDPWINARRGYLYWQPSTKPIDETDMINYYRKNS